ncbi:MAG TPA: oxygenase MpaB family protein [Kineosporiaceae bacterium]
MDDSRGTGAGDTGLFGPNSVTWRVHADPVIGIAGLRALLLQALHPVAVQALDQHSRYRDDPWGRVARTAEYVGVTTYGTTAQAMLAGSRVRAVHARISGRTAQGVPYQADDPQLLAWVHCCLVASFLELVTRAGLRLTGAEQDAYIAEQVRSAMLVGLEPDEVPHDRGALLDYFRVIRPVLECTKAARRAAGVVVAPPLPARVELATPARPAWASVAGLAFAALPPWARRLYALPELPGAAGLTDAAVTAALRTLRTTLRGVQCVVPGLREGPHLRAARARLEQ